ncbi:hypothetical protein J5X84_02020 [Streptosporangiaceae bacterium NEAU-GS5]|nr:hypothetical protein [Streptosporangiaceae bacterium NEAU-GS5]
MRDGLQFFGLYLFAAGISGTVDHMVGQPFMGAILNLFNRVVIPHVGFLTGYEIVANLTVSVLGAVLIIAVERIRP